MIVFEVENKLIDASKSDEAYNVISYITKEGKKLNIVQYHDPLPELPSPFFFGCPSPDAKLMDDINRELEKQKFSCQHWIDKYTNENGQLIEQPGQLAK